MGMAEYCDFLYCIFSYRIGKLSIYGLTLLELCAYTGSFGLCFIHCMYAVYGKDIMVCADYRIR
ncbi:MAG: hypothetical protein HDR22_06625 [Lachnospiraceae bacterium]|nr:hypothetical protein [Lachnospiraceae bacterium]